jgi:hypothetical protein
LLDRRSSMAKSLPGVCHDQQIGRAQIEQADTGPAGNHRELPAGPGADESAF